MSGGLIDSIMTDKVIRQVFVSKFEKTDKAYFTHSKIINPLIDKPIWLLLKCLNFARHGGMAKKKPYQTS